MAEIARTIEAVFRIERARLVGGLARFLRDVDLAEDLAQEALVAALSDWPASGIPANPGAWLMATAKRRGIDRFRRARLAAERQAEIGRTAEEAEDPVAALETRLDDDIGDEVLGLIFTACHPVLSREAQAALTLRLVGGLTTGEIARAFLTPEPTINQRITRAKAAIARAGARFEVPRGAELTRRLPSVLEVIYLIFNEGYAATAGEDLIRPALCAEARRLGRMLAAALPREAEVHGLLALMELQSSRLAARTGPDGRPVMLPDQNRALWDRGMIGRGLAALSRAAALGGEGGPYALQAALAACHAQARRAAETDWEQIAALYDRLAVVLPSAVVALNRAIAHGMAFGPQAALDLLAPLEASGLLRGYAPLPAAKANALMRLGRRAEAREAFLAAAGLTRNAGERAFLLAKAEAAAGEPGSA